MAVDIKRLRRLADAATGRPWFVDLDDVDHRGLVSVWTEPHGAELLEFCIPKDAEFVVEVVNNLPALLDEIERLRESLNLARESLKSSMIRDARRGDGG